MTSTLIYSYPPLIAGTLMKRYKRFFVDIELETGEIITAHCANTGPMTGIYIPGSPVRVSRSDNPKRKLAYSWEMIQLARTWVGVNTNLPNQVIKLALHRGLFADLTPDGTEIASEVAYGFNKGSRIDFLLSHADGRKTYLEIKNTTWTQGNIALFPDTVTTRGQKHLEELMAVLPEADAVMLYFINRDDCVYFAPGDRGDARYGKLFRSAIARGVKILPYRFQVTPEGIYYLGVAQMLPEQPEIGNIPFLRLQAGNLFPA
ncbi:MAG: Sugar fermentation stimulation protein A [Chroococcopsis gigantea SAG 12.99]|nr:DNA/RNA nuclease SfsA [Chlorogloea purpurea SAG 13.99]MDV3000670.1 Sugar fermentation stimulation protein A [Chroococcopsis gigantea SAG 12.99]